MYPLLNEEEIRVLGCLIEKKMTTPEYYPLSLNALVNACNQKTNRDPVVTYDEETVLEAVESLKEKRVIWQSNLSRVVKYEERFAHNNLSSEESAVVAMLLLRGPQTVGEIKGRTDRLYPFTSLEEVSATLENLISLGYIKKLPVSPGHKEARYLHLLAEPEEEPEEPIKSQPSSTLSIAMSIPEPPGNAPVLTEIDPLKALEEKVNRLSSELAELKRLFLDFRRQFE